MNIPTEDHVERVTVGDVSADFFPLFGARPQRGRTFTAAEDRPGGDRVAVISDAFWARRFQRRSAIGQTLRLKGQSFTIVGVLQPTFQGAIITNDHDTGPDVYLPMQIDPASTHVVETLVVAGRLRSSVSLGEAQSRVAATIASLRRRLPASVRQGDGAMVQLYQTLLRRNERASLLLLSGASRCHIVRCWLVSRCMRPRAAWHYSETGSGRPLVLLHGIGMSHVAWNAVTPYLCSTRRVIAFDTPGFGLTPPLPGGTVPTVPNLVEALEWSIHAIGIDVPVDIAGNSLGGCMALEAARRGIARRVVAISPCGLWRDHPAPHVKYVFGGLRFMARVFPNLVKATMRMSVLRELALAVPISVGSRRMRAGDALRAVDDLSTSAAFEETFAQTRVPFSGRDIAVPVTVAFGDRDWILPASSQRPNGLPDDIRWVKKQGWGHVPMWVDPRGVSQLILEGTR